MPPFGISAAVAAGSAIPPDGISVEIASGSPMLPAGISASAAAPSPIPGAGMEPSVAADSNAALSTGQGTFFDFSGRHFRSLHRLFHPLNALWIFG
jgi:hypothetical protein